MNRFTWMSLCCVMLGGAFLLAAEDEPVVKPKLERVQEFRSRTIGGEEQDKSFTSLNVQILLEGKPIVGAARFGRLKFKAVDDKGNELKMRESWVGEKEMQPIDRASLKLEESLPAEAMRLELLMDLPPRSATKLATLEGTVKLLAGTPTDVVFADPASLVGKEVEHAELKAAGVKLMMISFNPKGGAGLGIYGKVRVIGKEAAILGMSMVDAEGKTISTGGGSSGVLASAISYEIYGEDPLPEGAKLRIVVLKDMKEIAVPFQLKDVPLP